MGPGSIPHLIRRTWHVQIRPEPHGSVVTCQQCGPVQPGSVGHSVRTTALAHLAQHAQADALPAHLRTCQCAPHGCHWHPRHRGCDGPLILALTRGPARRTWRLADMCHGCAATCLHTAAVTEPAPRQPAPLNSVPGRRCPLPKVLTEQAGFAQPSNRRRYSQESGTAADVVETRPQAAETDDTPEVWAVPTVCCAHGGWNADEATTGCPRRTGSITCTFLGPC
jgi:hypothetical protein